MANYGDRFIVTHMEGNALSDKGKRTILVDRETGVNYIFVHVGYSGGLTPLLDADGKPVVTKIKAIPHNSNRTDASADFSSD